ncbi:MAG: FAD-binding oxidoreductase [bacterium]
MTSDSFEIAIVGAGIAGASAAYFLAPKARVIVLEREDQPGYHTTGRSAALFSETYGNASVRSLTRASRAFYRAPPAGFAAHPLLTPRGVVFFGQKEHGLLLEAQAGELRATGGRVEWLKPEEVLARVPALRPEWAAVGLLEPDAEDIDVHALLIGFLRGARAAGAPLVADAALEAMDHDGHRWRLHTHAGEIRADIVVNAAGAWADEVATLAGATPLGLAPLRRTAIVFECARHTDTARWPATVDATEDFYFRPEAGRMLASPADETPSPPCDAQPEELDVALLIDRLQAATTFDIARINSRRAGLRTFAPDRSLVAGFDAERPGFFWLAGQGGYGIQTAPAMGQLVAALVKGETLPQPLAEAGVDPSTLDPRRFTPATT